MSNAVHKTLTALLTLASHADEVGTQKGWSVERSNAEFLAQAAPYIHDLLAIQYVDGHGLLVRDGREVPANVRVTEVFQISHRIARDCGILREYLAHLRVELKDAEPSTPRSHTRVSGCGFSETI